MTKEVKHICIISAEYPTITNPVNTFVDQLVCAWADMGVKCTVISPENITKKLLGNTEKKPLKWSKTSPNGNIIEIYSPRYFSFSSKKIFGFNSINLTLMNYKKAVLRIFKRFKLKPDVVYGHFIKLSGISASYVGSKYNIPSFVAYGESSTDIFNDIGIEKITKLLTNVNGIISVSSENKKRLVEKGIVSNKKIEVFPNAINNKLFYKRDKQKVRKKLGYDKDDIIVAYVGHFIHRKGSLRLSKALQELPTVKSIFIGDGPDLPKGEGILHTGKVPHDKVPDLLSAADIFVLPTLNEGCCNAIVEAMACGLPIISSNLPFNDDILYKDNSIRINPKNVEEIREAIAYLKDNDNLRQQMSESSIKYASSLRIESRAKNILNFIVEKV